MCFLVQVGWFNLFGCKNVLGTSSVGCFDVDHRICVQIGAIGVHIDI